MLGIAVDPSNCGIGDTKTFVARAASGVAVVELKALGCTAVLGVPKHF